MNRLTISRRQLPGLLAAAIALPTLVACGGDDTNEAGFGVTDWPDGGGTGAAPGDLAPNFRLAASDGGTVTLSEYLRQDRQAVVVNFLATWCPNCMEEMDALQAVHASGVTVIGVNLRESAGTVADLIADTGATFPIGLDETGKVTREYKVVNLPGTAVLRADGTISTVFRGPITEESLMDAVREAGGG
jgi:peroxiredoxin